MARLALLLHRYHSDRMTNRICGDVRSVRE